MSMRIHICTDNATADKIILVENSKSPNVNFNTKKLLIPDVMIYDHTTNIDTPYLLNKNRICVVFSDI